MSRGRQWRPRWAGPSPGQADVEAGTGPYRKLVHFSESFQALTTVTGLHYRDQLD